MNPPAHQNFISKLLATGVSGTYLTRRPELMTIFDGFRALMAGA